MHRYWDDGWGGSGWGWLVMAVLMFVFWGGLAWLIVSLMKRFDRVAPAHWRDGAPPMPLGPAASSAPTPQDVLAHRLARGDIDPDEYRSRLDALVGAAPPGGPPPVGR